MLTTGERYLRGQMAAGRNKLQVRVDIPNNRLYCIVGGNVTRADIDSFFTEVRFGVADLKPGFAVITDLTNCHYSHLAAIPTYRKIMHYLASSGVREVVRVVNTGNLIYRQAMNLASRIQGYSTVYVKTLDEAESFLEQSQRRESLRYLLLRKPVQLVVDDRAFQGQLMDVSTSGCAVTGTSEAPAVGTVVHMSFALCDKKSDENRFEIDAEVVRHFGQGFAVRFISFGNVDRDKLQECLVQQARLDV